MVHHTVHHHSIIIIEEKIRFHEWKTNTQNGAFRVFVTVACGILIPLITLVFVIICLIHEVCLARVSIHISAPPPPPLNRKFAPQALGKGF